MHIRKDLWLKVENDVEILSPVWNIQQGIFLFTKINSDSCSLFNEYYNKDQQALDKHVDTILRSFGVLILVHTFKNLKVPFEIYNDEPINEKDFVYKDYTECCEHSYRLSNQLIELISNDSDDVKIRNKIKWTANQLWHSYWLGISCSKISQKEVLKSIVHFFDCTKEKTNIPEDYKRIYHGYIDVILNHSVEINVQEPVDITMEEVYSARLKGEDLKELAKQSSLCYTEFLEKYIEFQDERLKSINKLLNF